MAKPQARPPIGEPPPDNYTGPGYYPHGMAAEPGGMPDHVRWFDGESWIGPEVSDIWKLFYEFFVKLGFNPETLRLLLLMFGVMAFLIVIFLVAVLLNSFGGGDDVQPAASPTTSAVATTIEAAVTTTIAPASTTTTVATSTVAPSTTATTTESVAAIDPSGVWSFTWSWGVTVVSFEGDVTGEGNQWTFQGEYAGGGSSSWRPDSGSATCNLNGEPLADLSTPGSMSCTVTVPEDSWTGETTGQISLVLGEVTKFEYKGGGSGTSSSTSGSPIEVHLRPTG